MMHQVYSRLHLLSACFGIVAIGVMQINYDATSWRDCQHVSTVHYFAVMACLRCLTASPLFIVSLLYKDDELKAINYLVRAVFLFWMIVSIVNFSLFSCLDNLFLVPTEIPQCMISFILVLELIFWIWYKCTECRRQRSRRLMILNNNNHPNELSALLNV